MHHYISAFLVGIHIIWPTSSPGYDDFRNYTVWLSLIVTLVQALQYTYQSGLLYRLRSLGKVRDLHISIDGIPRYMFNERDSTALFVITPFLTIVYLYQFYLSFFLFQLITESKDGASWHVMMMSLCYLVLGSGNTITLITTLLHKEKKRKVLQGQEDKVMHQMKTE